MACLHLFHESFDLFGKKYHHTNCLLRKFKAATGIVIEIHQNLQEKFGIVTGKNGSDNFDTKINRIKFET